MRISSDRLIEGMMQPEMILETVEIMRRAIEQGKTVNILVNNRVGECVLVAQIIAEKFLGRSPAI
jgi:hypothetical protein